jgi:uncharacterized protein
VKRVITALLGNAFLIGNALAQTAVPTAPASPAVVAPTPVAVHPGLWVVKDADTTIYLFGTIHILKPEIKWFDGSIKSAFDASSELVIEMIEPEPAAMQALALKLAIDPDGPPLTTKLGPDGAAKYAKAAEGLGIPPAAFESFEPWMVSLTFSVMAITKAGFDPASGVDKVLAAAAKDNGKTIIGLETAEQQLGYFDGLPEATQIKFLNDSIAELPDAKPEFSKMIAAWSAGKPDKLAKDINASMGSTPEIGTMLLTDRNRRWARWITDRMAKPGTVFLAVGAGHLAGKNSVQDFLKELRVKAKRIRS